MNSNNKTTMLACGVITPQGSKTSRVTLNGWIIHCRDTVPVEHTVHAPCPAPRTTLSAVAFVFTWCVVIVLLGFLIVSLLPNAADMPAPPKPFGESGRLPSEAPREAGSLSTPSTSSTLSTIPHYTLRIPNAAGPVQ